MRYWLNTRSLRGLAATVARRSAENGREGDTSRVRVESCVRVEWNENYVEDRAAKQVAKHAAKHAAKQVEFLAIGVCVCERHWCLCMRTPSVYAFINSLILIPAILTRVS